MKKLLSLLLAVCLLAGLTACGAAESTPTETTAAPTTEATEPTTPQASIDALDGKKVLFIGNSYTFYGYCVMYQHYNVLTQRERTDNRGLFYYLCQEKGIDVEVTNWTFGGHSLTHLFGDACTMSSERECYGADHDSYLVDTYFDYVCIQPYTEPLFTGDFNSYVQPILDIFRAANPNVKFLLLVPHMAMERSYNWTAELSTISKEDFIICNWGGMLHDIVQKRIAVPGATQEYYRPTFVVSVSKEDGHHQNLLGGYLTTLMVYCAITGESAVGQPYDLCDNPKLNPSFDLEAFQAERYIHEPYTNFVEVFRSEADMRGLQELTDLYLTKFNGGN